MVAAQGFLTGIVEGFYGRPWGFEQRRAYAGYLASLGLNTALYCPKGDPYLRRQWHQPWPQPEFEQLRGLSRHYRQAGLNWGVGLSPFELYRHYGPSQRDALHAKARELERLEAPLLAVLFDDMPGDMDALAERQAEIVQDLANWLPATRLLVCPTYYSMDPVLQKYFGRMPENYWQQLGRLLPAQVDIFWTGNKVCSDSISFEDIAAINASLGRQVMLWDNYPVNDGALRSKFLYTRPLAQRDKALRPLLSGHLCNPMNQALLSLPALSGLAALYGAEPAVDWLPQALGPATWESLCRHADRFQQQGLEDMTADELEQLARHYQQLPDPAAAEVAGWLRGEYTFDPACLTD